MVKFIYRLIYIFAGLFILFPRIIFEFRNELLASWMNDYFIILQFLYSVNNAVFSFCAFSYAAYAVAP